MTISLEDVAREAGVPRGELLSRIDAESALRSMDSSSVVKSAIRSVETDDVIRRYRQ